MLDGVGMFSSVDGLELSWVLIDCFDDLILIRISGDEEDLGFVYVG